MKLYRVKFIDFKYHAIEETEIDGGRVSERTVDKFNTHAEAVGMVMLLRAKRHARTNEEKH